MSRVGKKVLVIPNGVQFSLNAGLVKVKGPKGELQFQIPEGISCHQEGTSVTFSRESDHKKVRALHGMTRAAIANMVEGVANGFTRNMAVVGVGFKVEVKSNKLIMTVGYSHPVMIIPPAGIEFTVSSPTQFVVKGHDKQLVGEIAAKIRSVRPPEPYKGKGVQYEGEYIRRKAGKAAGK